jgi:hypothetical protein
LAIRPSLLSAGLIADPMREFYIGESRESSI